MSDLTRRLEGDAATPANLTVVQLNVLADRLAFGTFVNAPDACLTWEGRRERILALLDDGLPEAPDLICLQEVDHHEFFAQRLGERGYADAFAAKREGWDGCSLFSRRDRFALEDVRTLRYLGPDGSPQTQVALLARLVPVGGGSSIHVATTHLKAREGHEEVRAAQARQLLEALPTGEPLVVAGDFNDVPGSAAYDVLTSRLDSAYESVLGDEPPWTTWKVRASGEVKRTIDYVWYAPGALRPVACLAVPADEEVDPARLPSWQYPSDHVSLATRLHFT